MRILQLLAVVLLWLSTPIFLNAQDHIDELEKHYRGTSQADLLKLSKEELVQLVVLRQQSEAPKPYKGTSWVKLGVFGRKVGQGPAHHSGGQAGFEISLHSYRKTSDGLTRPFGILSGGEIYFASKHNNGHTGAATNVAFFVGAEFQGWQNGYRKDVWLISSLSTRYHSDLSGNTDIKGLSLQGESLIKIRLPFELLNQEPVVCVAFGANFHPWGDAKFQPHIGVGFSFIFKAK